MSLSNDFKKIKQHRQNRDEEYWLALSLLLVKTFDEIEELIAVFYSKYGSDGKITESEATQRLNGSDFRIFKNHVKEYLEILSDEGIGIDKDLQTQINNTLDVTIPSRLTALQLEVLLLVSIFFGVQEREQGLHFADQYTDSLLMSVYYIFKELGKEKDFDKKLLDLSNLLSETWRDDLVTYDENLWRNKRYLNADITRQLNLGIRNETDFATLMSLLTKIFDKTKNRLHRDLVSDSTFFGTKGSVDGMEWLGVYSVIFCTIDDDRRSVWCEEADGNIIPVDEIVYGENAPPLPFHPCRSWLEPYEYYTISDKWEDSRPFSKKSYDEWEDDIID